MGAWCALVLVLAFPAFPAAHALLFSDPTLDRPPVSWWELPWLILRQTDSGGQLASGSGVLRGLVLGATILWFLRPRSLGPSLRVPAVLGGGFLVVSLISAAISSHPHDALVSWTDYLAVGLAFLVCAQMASEGDLDHVVPWLRGPGLMAWGLVLVALAVLPAGYARFLADQGADYGAMVGSFYQPNMFAAYLEFGLAASLALYFCAGPPSSGLSLRALVTGVASALILVALYRSYSQGAWLTAWGIFLLVLVLLGRGRLWMRLGLTLAGMVGILALVGVGFRLWAPARFVAVGAQLVLLVWLLRNTPRPRQTALKLLLLLLACWPLLLNTVPMRAKVDAGERAVTVARGDDQNTAARLKFWAGAVGIFRDHPWIGVGFQGYQRYSTRYQDDVRYFSKYAHSVSVTVLCETGVLGSLLFWGAVGSALVLGLGKLGRDADEVDRAGRVALLVGALGFGAHAQVDVQWEFLALPLTLSLVLGVLAGNPVSDAPPWEPEEEAAIRSPWSVRPSLLLQYALVCPVIALFLANVLVTFAEVRHQQGLAVSKRGKPEAGYSLLESARELDPFWGENCRQMALMLMDQMVAHPELVPKLGPEALHLADRAVALDSHRAVTVALRSEILSRLGDREEARRTMQRALELDPVNYPGFYFELANLEVEGGSRTRGHDLLVEATRRFPLSALDQMIDFRADAIRPPLSQVYEALGASENPTRNARAAEGYFRTAVELNPENATARFGLGVSCFYQKRLDEAARELEQVVEKLPEFAPAWSYLEQVYLARGEPEKAARARNEARKSRRLPAGRGGE